MKHWSKLQGSIALSSAESELYALNRAACEGLGVVQTCWDLGMTRTLDLFTDAAATKAIVLRKGPGRLKHIQVQELWLQQLLMEDFVEIYKIPRETNTADALTHQWTAREGDPPPHFPRVGVKFGQ